MKPNLALIVRLGVGTGILAVSFFLGGCATMELDLPSSGLVYTGNSPKPQLVARADAWKAAENMVKQNPGSDMVIGRGDSMLPLYTDRTLLVIKKMAAEEWQPGMTVVFIGDEGVPVAHALVKKTKRGWVAAGVGNSGPDDTRVTDFNYIGTAFAAFTPDGGENLGDMLAVSMPKLSETLAMATPVHSSVGETP